MSLSRIAFCSIGVLSSAACFLASGHPAFGRTITLDEWKELNRLGSYGGEIVESIDLEAELQKLYSISTEAVDLLECESADCLMERETRYLARMALFSERNSLSSTIAKLSPMESVDGGIGSHTIWVGEMAFPLASPARISSGFGWRLHPVTGQRRSFHQGTDLAAPTGTPVLASFSGTVSAAGEMGNLGNAVAIDSGSVRTRYGHMIREIVSAGDYVEKGQVIGYVGSTGRSTGPHLHFEVWHLDASGRWRPQDYTAAIRAALEQHRIAQSEDAIGRLTGRGGE